DATPSDPAKAKLLEDFKASGVTLLQRFFPSEFGNDVDHSHVVEAAKTILVEKVQFRRAVEASGIPYTFVVCNWSADDPRTLNKILYLRPSANTLTHNELVSLWEKKIGRTFQRVGMTSDEMLAKR
ncbi:hypothetical protein GW17_00051844, partial [Ensete ventricosum]